MFLGFLIYPFLLLCISKNLDHWYVCWAHPSATNTIHK